MLSKVLFQFCPSPWYLLRSNPYKDEANFAKSGTNLNRKLADPIQGMTVIQKHLLEVMHPLLPALSQQ